MKNDKDFNDRKRLFTERHKQTDTPALLPCLTHVYTLHPADVAQATGWPRRCRVTWQRGAEWIKRLELRIYFSGTRLKH